MGLILTTLHKIRTVGPSFFLSRQNGKKKRASYNVQATLFVLLRPAFFFFFFFALQLLLLLLLLIKSLTRLYSAACPCVSCSCWFDSSVLAFPLVVSLAMRFLLQIPLVFLLLSSSLLVVVTAQQDLDNKPITCGCNNHCTQAVLQNYAGGQTCLTRIKSRLWFGESEEEACTYVAERYPLQCGPQW